MAIGVLKCKQAIWSEVFTDFFRGDQGPHIEARRRRRPPPLAAGSTTKATTFAKSQIKFVNVGGEEDGRTTKRNNPPVA